MDRCEIMKKVYEKYPVTKEERTCRIKKQNMDEKRMLLKKRLIKEAEQKKVYDKN